MSERSNFGIEWGIERDEHGPYVHTSWGECRITTCKADAVGVGYGRTSVAAGKGEVVWWTVMQFCQEHLDLLLEHGHIQAEPPS